MERVYSYIDDVIVLLEGWSFHLMTLGQLLELLSRAGLTAKLFKCVVGLPE